MREREKTSIFKHLSPFQPILNMITDESKTPHPRPAPPNPHQLPPNSGTHRAERGWMTLWVDEACIPAAALSSV